jgi:hypothetical protein
MAGGITFSVLRSPRIGALFGIPLSFSSSRKGKSDVFLMKERGKSDNAFK